MGYNPARQANLLPTSEEENYVDPSLQTANASLKDGEVLRLQAEIRELKAKNIVLKAKLEALSALDSESDPLQENPRPSDQILQGSEISESESDADHLARRRRRHIRKKLRIAITAIAALLLTIGIGTMVVGVFSNNTDASIDSRPIYYPG